MLWGNRKDAVSVNGLQVSLQLSLHHNFFDKCVSISLFVGLVVFGISQKPPQASVKPLLHIFCVSVTIFCNVISRNVNTNKRMESQPLIFDVFWWLSRGTKSQEWFNLMLRWLCPQNSCQHKTNNNIDFSNKHILNSWLSPHLVPQTASTKLYSPTNSSCCTIAQTAISPQHGTNQTGNTEGCIKSTEKVFFHQV